MKTRIIVASALLVSIVSFGQKRELRDAEKAIKSGNFADAKSSIASAESLISNEDEKMRAEFYFLKGQALYANGTGTNEDIDKAIESFEMAESIEEESGKKKYTDDIEEVKTKMLNNFLTKANAALQSKDYIKSSQGFDKAYRMSPKDTLYLYYAASTAVTAQDYDSSLRFYEELRDLGYSGVGMEYYATNKETGEEENFDNKSLRDLSVRAGTHIAPKRQENRI